MSEFITRFHATSKFCERLSSDITLAEMTSYIFPNCFGETGSDKYILILVNELPPSLSRMVVVSCYGNHSLCKYVPAKLNDFAIIEE